MVSVMTSVRIRAATPEDAEKIAALVLLSAEHFLPAVFGPRVQAVLAMLAARGGTLFSFAHARMAVVDDRVVGMLLGYSAVDKAREDPKTGLGLFRVLGISMVRGLPKLLRVQKAIGGMGPDEWYVSNVGVLPDMRGRGVGGALLLDADQRARSNGARAIVLDVETDNPMAAKLYGELGYRIVRTTAPLLLEGRQFAFHRMSKPLGPNAPERSP